MAMMKTHKSVLKKLQQQISTLKRKEKNTQKKLVAALSKARKMAKLHRLKLVQTKQENKAKLAAVKAEVYGKLASSIQKKATTVKRKLVKKSVKKLK